MAQSEPKLEMDAESNLQQGPRLYSTFWIADRFYGIDVRSVQEITKPMAYTRVPLAPKFVQGLINLRGQIATAIDLRNLFMLKEPSSEPGMNVFCETKDLLLSLVVDKIGDVIEVDPSQFELAPPIIPQKIRDLMNGIYKIDSELLSILEINKIAQFVQGFNAHRGLSP